LQDANLSGANLSGVGWDAVTLAGEDMSNENLTDAHINGSSMTQGVTGRANLKFHVLANRHHRSSIVGL